MWLGRAQVKANLHQVMEVPKYQVMARRLKQLARVRAHTLTTVSTSLLEGLKLLQMYRMDSPHQVIHQPKATASNLNP